MLHGADLRPVPSNLRQPLDGAHYSEYWHVIGQDRHIYANGLPVLINELGEISFHVREKGLVTVIRDVSEIPGILCHFDPRSIDA